MNGVAVFFKAYFCGMKTIGNDKRLLILGQVWPESNSSAAGTRMLQLIRFFKACGLEIFFGTTARKSEFSDALETMGVQEVEVWLNDARTNEVLKALNPDVVLYDRFMMEEQFGWRVSEQCPDAMTILDTEDLHFLRYARQAMYKDGKCDVEDYLYSERTKRELASILRCDVSLLISEFEVQLLHKQFQIPKALLLYVPFLEADLTDAQLQSWKPYAEREGFVFIGNFIHEPNWQAVLRLKKEVWPLIRKKRPGLRLHIYGAYPSQKVLQLHDEVRGFCVHGRATDALKVVGEARVMLAPISFGAGVKGKFVDAMKAGTPSVTTTIGAEGMGTAMDWGGFVEDVMEAFANKAIALYEDRALWYEKQQLGTALFQRVYADAKYLDFLTNRLGAIYADLTTHRNQNFIGQVMKHNLMQNTKYMALWIEEKNKKTD